MLSFHLSQPEVDIVNIERKTHPQAIIRDRMYVLHLLHLGYSRKECAIIVGCHYNSVSNYIKLYNQGGLDLLRQTYYGSPRHELHDRYQEVEQAIKSAHCSTLCQVAAVLRQQFHYDRSTEAVRQLMHRLGFKRRKGGTFPGKIKDFEKWQAQQEAFINKFHELIQQAENQEIDLIFGDAAHFVYGQFSHYLWAQKAYFIPSGHGRYRINVYGAYDVITNQVFSMYNEGYIDADFIVQYFHWLRQQIYPNLQRPLHLVLDNARYQHCSYVKQTAEKLNIILEFLPGYSPNLNLIERLWKYLKKQIGQQYYDSKKAFHKAVVKLLRSLNQKKHQIKIWNLLNPRFQRFEKSQILTC